MLMKHRYPKSIRLIVTGLFLSLSVCLSAQKSVWTESFEGGILPSGWTEEKMDGSLNWTFEQGTVISNDSAYDGVYRARLIGQGTTRLVLPMTDIKTGITMPYLRFAYKLKMTDSRIDTLRVLYRTETTGEWRYLQNAEYSDQKIDWSYEEIPLSEISTVRNAQIAFEGKTVFGGGILLDFVSIGDQYNCATPPTDLTARQLTPNSATLRWFGNNNDMGRKYYIVIDTIEHTIDLETIEAWKRDTVEATGDEHYEVTGLEPNRDYFFYVKSDCDYNDLSDWSDGCAFHTPCLPQPLPLVELFEDDYSSECWLFYKGEATTPYITSSTSGKPFQGSKYLYFYASSGKGMSYAAMPAPDADLNTLMFSFMGYSGYNGTIEIGVLEDPNDPSTYQTIKIFTTTNDKTYRRYCVDFDDYTGTGKYIAIVNQAGLSANGFCIDSVRLEEKPECPPLFLQEASAVTATSALFTWSSIGDETAWVVRLFSSVQTNPETATPLKEYNVQGNMELQLEELTPNTEYFVYVKPTCGTEWVGDSFTTGTAITIPYTDNFDNYGASTSYNADYLPDGWIVGNLKSTSTSTTYYPLTYGKSAYTANYAYDHTDNPNNPYHAAFYFKGSTTYYQPYAIMPQIIGVDDIKGLMLQFYAYSTVGDLLTIGVMEDPSNMETFVPVRTITLSEEWNLETVYFDAYQGDGCYITFVLHMDAKPSSTPNARIDDLTITVAPNCRMPLDLNAKHISARSLDLMWDGYTETQWKLQIATDEAMTELVKDTLVNRNDSCHIGGLIPMTDYYVRVCANCGTDEVSEWTHAKHFQTYAEINTLPYENSFDDISGTTSSTSSTVEDYLVPQWYVWNISGASSFVYTPHVYGSTTYNAARDHRVGEEEKDYYNCVKMSSSKSYNGSCMVSPEITAVENVEQLQISFWGYTSTAGYTVTVGVADNPADTSTYVSIETFTLPKTEWTYCVAFLDSYVGSGKYIYLLSSNPTSTNLVYVDDIEIKEIPDCPEVTNITIKEGTLTDISASFVWDANNAEEWNMKIFDSELTEEEIDTQTPIVNISGLTNTEKLVEGLEGNRVYYVYIQSVNEAKNCVGSWSVPLVFRTACSTIGESLPFYADFENEGSGVIPSCWTADVFGSSAAFPKTDAHSTSSSATDPIHDGSEYSLYFTSSNTGGAYAWAATPLLNITDIRNLQLTFIGTDDEPSTIQIGICDQPNNLQNFILVKECKVSELKTWNHFTVLFNNVNEAYKGYKYIIFRVLNTGTSGEYSSDTDNYFYLDDVLIQEIPDCVKAFDVALSEIKQTSALVNWSGNDETSWDICVFDTLISSEAVDTYIDDAIFYVVDNTVKPYRLEDLPTGTELYVYVRTKNQTRDCVGDWSIPGKMFTQCSAVDIPYYDDFEDYRTVSSATASGNLQPEEFPKCLTCTGSTTTAPTLYGLGSGNFNFCEPGTTALFMTTSDGKTNYVSFPEMNVDNVNMLEVAFKACKTLSNVKSGIIRIGVMDDPYDPTTFTKVWEDTLKNYLSQSKEWTSFVVKLDSYIGSGKNITISMPGLGTTNHAYFDWIRIDTIQPVHAPLSTTIESVSEDSVSAAWDVIDGEKWRIRIIPYTDNVTVNDTATVDTVVTSPYATFGSLAYDTHYMLYVAGIQANDTSQWGEGIKFRSACPSSVALPYFEDFKAYDVNEYCCWTSLNTNENKDTVAYVNTHSDSDILALNFPKGCRMMLPAFTNITSIESLRITFTALPMTTAYNVTVWAYDGNNNYMNVGIANVESSIYDKRQVDFSFSFEGATQYRYIALGMDNPGFITNVMVEEDNCPRPINVRLTNRMDTAVTITWEAVGASVDSWEIEYGPSNFTIGQGIRVETSTPNRTIHPLNPETEYDIYIRSVDTDNNLYSEWVKAESITTMPSVATIPYFCDFEEIEECEKWQQIKYETTEQSPNNWYFGILPGTESGNVAYISNDGGTTFAFTSDNIGTQDLYRNIYLKTGKYKISFDWQNVGDTDDYANLTASLYTPGCIPNLSNSSYWQQETGVNATSAYDALFSLTIIGREEVDEGTGQATWRRDSTILDVNKDGVYTLNFRFKCGANRIGKERTPAAIDNIAIEMIPCTAPTNVTVTNILDTAFTLTWNPSLLEEMNEWQVKIFETGVRYEDLSTQEAYIDTIVTTPSVTFDTLQANTTYYYAIRMICGEDTWTPVNNVTTLCAPMALPMVETFESYTTGTSGTRPECWIYSDPLTYNGIYVASGKNGHGLYIGTDTYIILPLFDENINNIELRFDFACAAANKMLYVGLVSDPFDINTFDEITSVYSEKGSTGNWYECETNFFNYDGEGRYIAIKGESSFYLDSIQVRTMPDCARVMQIEATGITRDAVTLDWLTTDEQSWNVKLTTQELDNMQQTNGVIIDTLVYEHPITLSSLEAWTEYYVYIQANCDDGESDWSKPYVFRTECGTYELPFVEDFSRYDDLNSTFDRWEVEDAGCWTMRYAELDAVFSGSTYPNTLPVINENYPETQNSRWALQVWQGSNNPDSVKVTTTALNGQIYYSPSGSSTSGGYESWSERKVADWFISPEIIVSGENVRLVFDLSIGNKESILPSDRFAMLVSEDAGETWLRENATIWSGDASGDLQMQNIREVLSPVSFDMTKYIGKTIKIAFYIERLNGASGSSLTDPVIHIDNVALRCFNEYVLEDVICQNNDYNRNGFFLAYDKVVNDTILTRESLTGECDSLITLYLYVTKPQMTPLSAEICQNESYTEYNFNLPIQTETGVFEYRQYLRETGGCDSIVVLQLTVHPTYKDTDIVVIQDNELPFVYNDTTFEIGSQSGLYSLLYATEFGCDSIIIVDLTIENSNDLSHTFAGTLSFKPNPVSTNSTVYIDCKLTDPTAYVTKIELFNSLGALIYMKNNIPTNFMSPQEAGIYIVRITTNTNDFVIGKLIVE